MKANSLKKKVWSRNYRLPPLGAAKENEIELFEITTLILYDWMETVDRKMEKRERVRSHLVSETAGTFCRGV